MQIIQGIRDKGAAITIALIALALIAFILMDARRDSSGGRSSSSGIGKINGNTVEQGEFNKKVKQAEDQEEQRTGRRPSGGRSAEIRQQTWDQIVTEQVLFSEADKLGIDFGSKELSVLLSSNDPSNPLMQDKQMIDPNTGRLDMSKVSQALTNIKKMKGEQREILNEQIVDPARLNSIAGKYYSLLNAGTYYPSWMEDKDNRERKTFAQISYVSIPYSVIKDSATKVTDDEIEAYVSKHKDRFKQEAGRMISYVAFSQLPSADDSATTKKAVMALKDGFAAEANPKSFLARNTTAIEYDSSYLPKSKINSPFKDSIINTPIGTVYGPYVDQNSFVLARVLATKTIPDSAKARHILIATTDPQTRQPILEDSIAKKRADSIFNAIKGGADFAALARQYSSDGSRDKGGDLGNYFGYGAMVPEFNDFCFNKAVGSMDVVHTVFGYHIVNVLSQKGSSPAYKTAYMAKEITASETTVNNASLAATKLAADKDARTFDTAILKKKGLKKISVPTLLKENDAQAGQLQDARQLIRWVFEAQKGDISDPYSIGDQFIVATVDNIFKEGTQDVKTARPLAEPAIRDERKGAEILKKLGSNPTLESAAAAYSKEVQKAGADSSILFTSFIINNIGQEFKIIGASFNKDNQAKVSPPILGKQGVYLLKVDGYGTKTDNDGPAAADQKKKQQVDNLRNLGTGNWIETLKKQANIKDERSAVY